MDDDPDDHTADPDEASFMDHDELGDEATDECEEDEDECLEDSDDLSGGFFSLGFLNPLGRRRGE